MKKICNVCGVEKDIEEFCFRNDTKKYKDQCKLCVNQKNKEYYSKNKERIIEKTNKYYLNNKELRNKYYLENSEEIKRKKKEYYLKNIESIKKRDKEYYSKNKDKILNKKKEYFSKNKQEIIQRHGKYMKNRKKTDIEFNITCRLRDRIRIAIKNQYTEKASSTIELLGCTPKEAYDYLVSKFTNNMTEESFMRGEIHIDHITPCASFDLTDPEQQKSCFNFRNLQPLWASDNLSKGAKIL